MASGARNESDAPDAVGGRGAGRSEALPRGARIASPLVFREAYGQSEGYAAQSVVLWPRRGPGAATRLGVVAAKRTFPTAVQRARAKRLIREAFRRCRYLLATDVDLVIIARRRILETSVDHVRRDLMQLARRLRLTSSRDDRGGTA